MPKIFTITVTERPPVEFDSFDDLKRYAESLPTNDVGVDWEGVLRDIRAGHYRRLKRRAARGRMPLAEEQIHLSFIRKAATTA